MPSVGQDVEQLELSCFTGENAKWCSRSETVWQFLRTVNTLLANDLAIPLLGIYPREMKTYLYTKKNLYMNIHSNVIHNYQNLEKQQMFFTG